TTRSAGGSHGAGGDGQEAEEAATAKKLRWDLHLLLTELCHHAHHCRFITCGDEVNIHQHNRSGEQSDLYNKKAEAMPSSALINNKAKVQFADLPENLM
uniref:Uncharacterized protein n=1 Tax=Oryza glaberrima TaxID=4538 RepID=I1R6R7_ORYGL